jgi:hypothetical protein
MNKTLQDIQNYLDELAITQDGEGYQRGWDEAIEMVVDVVREMYNTYNFHNPTLDELEQRIV